MFSTKKDIMRVNGVMENLMDMVDFTLMTVLIIKDKLLKVMLMVMTVSLSIQMVHIKEDIWSMDKCRDMEFMTINKKV